MVDDCKDDSGRKALELAEDWVKAVIAGDGEKAGNLAAQIREARELRMAILAAIGRLIGILGQSFGLLLGSLDERTAVPRLMETATAAALSPTVAQSPAVTLLPKVVVEQEYKSLLSEFQRKVSWGSPESDLTRLKNLIIRSPAARTAEEKEKDMETAAQRGKNFKALHESLRNALKKGPMSDYVFEAYQAAPDWYKRGQAQKLITKALVNAAQRLIGNTAEMDSFTLRAGERYPFACSALSSTKEAADTYRKEQMQTDGALHMPEIFSGAEHRLNFMQPSPEWTVYIDETGTGFNPAEAETQGKIVSVLVPRGVNLPNIASSFHSSNSMSPIVLSNLNTLLSLPVGLLGFSARSLHNMSADAWFQNIRELLDWIWRLLPLPDDLGNPVSLNVIIEQREDAPGTNLDPMARAINQNWDKENPERHKRVTLASLRIAPKSEPNLPWADVAAYIWGTSKPEIVKGYKQSGLSGTCYFDVEPELMRRWVKGCVDRDPLTGPEWLRLLTENDAGRRGSLTWLALEPTKKRCLESPDLARNYIETLRRYLDDKKYDLKILDRLIRWLSAVKAEETAPDLRFYWESAKLVNHNHAGDFSSEAVLATRKTLRELLSGMGEKDPQAAVQARLRLAVSCFNAYDFNGALDELAVYNPMRSGRLPEDGLSAGKALSSLGQAEAFLGRNGPALELFDQAAAAFARLTRHPDEAAKQGEQTGIYAAIAAMDDPAAPKKEKRRRVEQALGLSVLDAAKQFSRDAADNEARYLQHLLTRYLASFGCMEEKRAYLAGAAKWPILGLGMGTGHPWYLIQYYRWLMLPGERADDKLLKDAVLKSIFEDCLPDAPGLTVELIGLALALATGRMHQASAVFRSRFERLEESMPKAQAALEALIAMPSPGGPAALAAVLPFNYR
jgi:hypothetical protein